MEVKKVEQNDGMRLVVDTYELKGVGKWGWEARIYKVKRNEDGIVLTAELVSYEERGFTHFTSSIDALLDAINHFS